MKSNLNMIIDYIQNTRIEECDEALQEHVKKCFLDLIMVTCCGTRNPSSALIAEYAEKVLPGTDATVLRTNRKSSLMGATVANAAAANALDIDDGYSLTKGHPGAGLIGGILAAAEFTDCTFGDVLSALLVGYEVSMRQGICLQDYYGFYHSTGAYAGFGTAAAVGKLLNLSREEVGNALGIADYYGPLVPCMRTVREPSLNKDGIYLGSKLGMEAVLLAKSGIDGKAHIMTDEAYVDQIASLGHKHYIYDLYFKFFSCCRWAQGALTALKDLRQHAEIDLDKIERINVYSYGASGELYTGMPKNEMEAQYNMRYPVAVYLLTGEYGPIQSSISIDTSDNVQMLMQKITFAQDAEYETLFPAKRLTRVEVLLSDGNVLKSQATEPLGEPTSNVTMQDIIHKGIKINGLYTNVDQVKQTIDCIVNAKYDDRIMPILEQIFALACVENEVEND